MTPVKYGEVFQSRYEGFLTTTVIEKQLSFKLGSCMYNCACCVSLKQLVSFSIQFKNTTFLGNKLNSIILLSEQTSINIKHENNMHLFNHEFMDLGLFL